MMFAVTLLTALIAGTGAAEAASFLNNCTTYCHGMPPRDGARKGNLHFGSQSSAFIGNHKNHLSATPVAGDCAWRETATRTATKDRMVFMVGSAQGWKGCAKVARGGHLRGEVNAGRPRARRKYGSSPRAQK